MHQNKQVIIINGSGECGKDTFINLISKYLKTMNVSSIDPYRELINQTGWDGIKNEAYRKVLSDLKQISINYNDGPTKYLLLKYQEFLQSSNELMFMHIREPEEIQKILTHLTAITLLITNSRIAPITTNKSDANVLNYNYDYTIDNDGTLAQLEEKAKHFAKMLTKPKR